MHGERFILGLGRGEKDAFKGMGIKVTTFEAMADYVDIYRRLWAGEAVSYDGPAGKFTHLAFADTYVGKQPEIWLAGYANGMGAECLVKAGFNGIILPPIVTPVMVAAAKVTPPGVSGGSLGWENVDHGTCRQVSGGASGAGCWDGR